MSWMDLWSRPSKTQAAPPPFYLTQGDNARYCHSCGRVIGSRRANSSKANSAEVKYCSDKCKRNKPNAFDRSIEDTLLALLLGENVTADGDIKGAVLKSRGKAKKGDPRIIVKMSDLELAVFGNMQDPERVYGRNKNRAKRGVPDSEEWKSIDMEHENQPTASGQVPDHDERNDNETSPGESITLSQTHVRPSQLHSDVNGSVGGEKGWSERIEETSEMLQKRRDGQKKAENRELLRNAARKAVVFGLSVKQSNERSNGKEQQGEVKRKCEAMMNGTVVDPSFAKGDWCVRWRED